MSRNKSFSLRGRLVAAFLLTMALPNAWAQIPYKNLHTFTKDGAGGAELTGGLVLDAAGNLYGTTAVGGTRDFGTVFKLAQGSDGRWTETVLHSFVGPGDGSFPGSSLVFDQAGNLYGTTAEGGPYNRGTVFELSPGSNGRWTESVIYSFCPIANCSDGADPISSLVFDQSGNLYGTTRQGGSNLYGTVFELKPKPIGAWTETVLYDFCPVKGCADGQQPYAGVIFDQAGNLYGTTTYGGGTQCGGTGCGVVFKLTPNAGGSWTESVLYSFCSLSGCDDGIFPLDSLVFDQAGNLYGTAELGGTDNDGLVFELSPSSVGAWTGKVLHTFKGTDGGAPYANLIFDTAGNLYGTTFEGGSGGGGVVFALKPKSSGAWEYIILHNFFDNPGAILFAPVVMDSAGNLYGTSYGDSNNTFGSVYEISP
jgi:uncharacterized repeat protein (TIGR03803 family)